MLENDNFIQPKLGDVCGNNLRVGGIQGYVVIYTYTMYSTCMYTYSINLFTMVVSCENPIPTHPEVVAETTKLMTSPLTVHCADQSSALPEGVNDPVHSAYIQQNNTTLQKAR